MELDGDFSWLGKISWIYEILITCFFIKANLNFAVAVPATLENITDILGARIQCYIFLVFIYWGKNWQGRVLSFLQNTVSFLGLTNKRCLWGVQPHSAAKQTFLVLQSGIPKLSRTAQLWAANLLHANAVFDLSCLLGQTVLRFWNLILVPNFKAQCVAG